MNPSMNRRLKRFLTVAVTASLAVIATSAIALSANKSAGSGDPFQGISAGANSPAGVTDSTALATLNSLKARHSGPFGGQLLEQARLLPTSISGRHLYLIPSTSGNVCVFVQATMEACTSPLTASHPALFSVVDPDGPGGTGPVVFGVATDDVSTISFTVAGVKQTVPVRGNVFEYQAAPSVNADDVTNATATSTNGQDASLG